MKKTTEGTAPRGGTGLSLTQLRSATHERAVTRRSFLTGCAAAAITGCVGPPERKTDVFAWGRQGTRDGDFMHPRAIGIRDGRVYVVDKTGRVQVFTHEGEFLHLWSMPEHENGTPTCVSFTKDGRVLIPDTHYSRIAEYTPDGELITMWGSYGNAPGRFIYPTGIAEAPSGEYFVSEYGQDAERVQVFSAKREFLRTWGAHGDAPGQFNRAMAIAVGADGVVCVADTTNHRLQLFDAAGELLRIIGHAGAGRGEFKFPHDLAISPDGSIVVCEYGANRISRYSNRGEFIGDFGAAGRSPGEFAAPRGVAITDDGTVFVADTENHRVQRFGLGLIA